MDGNTSAATWTAMVFQQAGLTLPDALRAQVLFVADSKMVSEATVEDCCAADIAFVSRLPNTFGLERQTKETVRKAGQWDVDRPVSGDRRTIYRVCESPGLIGDAAERLVVVHSSALAAKAQHWEETQTVREAQALDQQIAHWACNVSPVPMMPNTRGRPGRRPKRWRKACGRSREPSSKRIPLKDPNGECRRRGQRRPGQTGSPRNGFAAARLFSCRMIRAGRRGTSSPPINGNTSTNKIMRW